MSDDQSFGEFLRRMRTLRGRPYGDAEPARRQARLAHNVWQMHCALLGWKANVVARSFGKDGGSSTYLTLDGNLNVAVTIGTQSKITLGLQNTLPQGPTDWLNIGDLSEGKRINFWQNHEQTRYHVSQGVTWSPVEHEYPMVMLNLLELNALQAVPVSLEWKAHDFRQKLDETIITAEGMGVRCDVLGYSCPDLGVVHELQQMWPSVEQVPTHVADIETDRLTLYVGLLGAVDWFGRSDEHAHFSEMSDAGYPMWIPIDFWRE